LRANRHIPWIGAEVEWEDNGKKFHEYRTLGSHGEYRNFAQDLDFMLQKMKKM
jgi:hypothetical protein